MIAGRLILLTHKHIPIWWGMFPTMPGFCIGLDIHRLPSMKPFVYQVQSASDYLKAGAAWLSGQKPPQYEDTEQTIEEVSARIRKTVEFARGVKAEQYAHAGEQAVKLSWAPGKVLKGNEYLLQMIVPNVYFHVAMAYAILRKGGVDVGKMDFLGPIDFVDA
jgi:hypothetical protein